MTARQLRWNGRAPRDLSDGELTDAWLHIERARAVVVPAWIAVVTGEMVRRGLLQRGEVAA